MKTLYSSARLLLCLILAGLLLTACAVEKVEDRWVAAEAVVKEAAVFATEQVRQGRIEPDSELAERVGLALRTAEGALEAGKRALDTGDTESAAVWIRIALEEAIRLQSRLQEVAP